MWHKEHKKNLNNTKQIFALIHYRQLNVRDFSIKTKEFELNGLEIRRFRTTHNKFHQQNVRYVALKF